MASDINEVNFVIEDNIIKSKISLKEKKESFATTVLNIFDSSPEFVAQIDAATGEQITYSQMKDNSVRCALWLKKQGVGLGDVVVQATDKRMGDYLPILATSCVGAIFSPWNYKLDSYNARRFLQLTQPKVLFLIEENAEFFVQAAEDEKVNAKFVVYGQYPGMESLYDVLKQQTSSEVNNFEPLEISRPEKQPGAIIFSSGTTGLRKGVAISYNTFYNTSISQCAYEENLTAICYTEMEWILGSIFFLCFLRLKWKRIIHRKFDSEETAHLIEKYKINYCQPGRRSIFDLVESGVFSRYDLSSIKKIMIGGCKIGQTTLQRIQSQLPKATLIYRYGSTEVLQVSGTNKCEKLNSIGQVARGVQLKIINRINGKSLGPYEEGEVLVKSDNLMLGYYKQPEATKAAFNSDGWFCMGDIAYYDESGELFFVDRLKDFIRFRNVYIRPSHVEKILSNHPAVLDVIVIGAFTGIEMEHPMAFVKKISGCNVSEEELVAFHSTYEKSFSLSGFIKYVDEFPYTSVGKIDRKALRQMLVANN